MEGEQARERGKERENEEESLWPLSPLTGEGGYIRQRSGG